MDLGATYLGSVADNILTVLREQEFFLADALLMDLLDESFAYLHIHIYIYYIFIKPYIFIWLNI